MIDMDLPEPNFGPAGRAAPKFTNGTARDAAQFRAELERAQEQIRQRHHMLFQRVLADLLTQLVQRNPVGNPDLWQHPRKGYVGGHSRRNWQVRTTPVADEIPGIGNPGGFEEIARIPVGQLKAYLVNPVPYMERLDQGWSTQAPAGWIDDSLRTVLAKYERAK